MGMSGGSSSGPVSDMNVTPMIDVLLVLIIIFMVIQPTTPKGLEALVPQPPKQNTPPPPDNDRTIVVQVLSGGALPTYKINEQAFAKNDIQSELTRIFSTRTEKVMFIKGDRDLNFSSVAEVIGMGHAADVTNIGLMTPQVEAGH
jgi:biopolymer transport protein TolR